MKTFIKKIISSIFNPKNEKLVLIGLPCLAIAIALCVIVPVVFSLSSGKDLYIPDETEAPVKASAVSVSSTKPPVKPVTEVENKTEEIPAVQDTEVYLTGVSTERDLYVFVRGMDSRPVEGFSFTINVQYPSGEVGTYKTDTDGGCYLVSLNSGNYTVSLQKAEGFTEPEPIVCSVKDKIAYTAIDEIEDIVEVTDVSSIINEVKVNEAEAPAEVTAEVVESAPVSVPTGNYIYDSNGNICYDYNPILSSDGYILGSDGNPTAVKPDYDENGRLIGGLEKTGEYEYRSINLFNADNTPVPGYMIEALPVRGEDTVISGWSTENGIVSYILNDGTKATGLKNIDGKVCYFDCNGRKASSVGIDVSFYNGTINWSAVKNAGIDFVIIRVGGRGWGTGALYDDSCFYNYLRGAKAAGLKVGVYFYSTAVNRVEAVQEASLAIDRLGGTAIDFPVYIDTELSGEYPDGRSDSLSVAERVEIVQAFCETIRNSGYRPGVYSGEYFLFNNLNYSSVAQYNIWMANYTEDNRLPSTTSRYDIWQFTDRGKINGVNGYCDLNVIF